MFVHRDILFTMKQNEHYSVVLWEFVCYYKTTCMSVFFEVADVIESKVLDGVYRLKTLYHSRTMQNQPAGS